MTIRGVGGVSPADVDVLRTGGTYIKDGLMGMWVSMNSL